ncbi:hypothetical protein [Clostridium sp. C105KSO13]|uniref:hypothetical protein n=1 Tax=Clostridium sp. C105KSO13 TaxID=1776045 RepID=UPI00074084F8|nr:hypothetical protein [Clostridium sp. C105KSO13]CUX20780.1 hypothetical protein BN3456_00442 [Clostridium sp. C105KSO13]
MEREQSAGISNYVKNTINIISGEYVTVLVGELFSNGQSVSDMEDIYFALAALVDTGKAAEAFHMIRGIYAIAGMEYPVSIAAMEQSKDIMEFFVTEAVYDFFDIIDECRLDEKIAE